MILFQTNNSDIEIDNPLKIKFKLFIFNVLIILVVFSSCVSEINVPVSTQTAKGPVVKLLITPDSTLTAYCSKVVDITSPFYQETNAIASLKVSFNQSPRKFNLLQPGQYILKSTFQPKDSFYFDYENKEDTFSVSGKLPARIVISKIDTSTQLIAGIGFTQTFNLYFKDSALYSNFYRLYVLQVSRKYTLDANNVIIDSITVTENMKIDGTELPFLRNSYNSYTDKVLLFNDETFNGVEANFQFYNLSPSKNSKTQKLLSRTVVLESTTKALYDYFNTEAAHIWQQQSITQIPGQVSTNIPNGYGVIGAYTVDKKTIIYP